MKAIQTWAVLKLVFYFVIENGRGHVRTPDEMPDGAA